MELQQSPLYANYIASLKWQIITVDGVRMFYKKIPFLGGILKIQRPQKLPRLDVSKYNVRTIAIEPRQSQNVQAYKHWCNKLSKHVRVARSQYMPSKTILVDLRSSEDKIFARFSEAKRRGVRRAQKYNVVAKESNNIKDLIKIKNISGGFLGFITTIGISTFWSIFSPKHATIVLAHHNKQLVGGVLLVFWNKTAFYWVAGASKIGKKLFAPTILVWEGLRVAKKWGASYFDFLGVWDERRPNEHNDWKGFTRFKEGFGGKEVYYPIF